MLSAFIRVNLRPKMIFSQLLTLTLGACVQAPNVSARNADLFHTPVSKRAWASAGISGQRHRPHVIFMRKRVRSEMFTTDTPSPHPADRSYPTHAPPATS